MSIRNLDIWRCEAWHEPLGSVFGFDHIPDQRDTWNASTMACYVATDAAHAISKGTVADAVAPLFRCGVALSLWALVEEMPQVRRVAHLER